jgi:hypothetical protein
VPDILISHHWEECLTNSLNPKVNIIKYKPLSRRVKRPVRRASKELTRPPMPTTIGKGRALPSIAQTYIPVPKNEAEASEMYRVGAEKIAQLTVRTMYMKMLVREMII